MSEMKGIQLITYERRRQQTMEGWTLEHDLCHRSGELRANAAALIAHGTNFRLDPELGDTDWDWGLVKKHGDSRIRALVIAGALIAAEIDRELEMLEENEE